MAIKTVCVVPHDWTLQTYSTHSCQDGSHTHLSHAELYDHRQQHVVIDLAIAQTRREKTIVQIFLVPKTQKPNVTKSVCAPRTMNRGLSFRVGAYLAWRIEEGDAWAKTMQSDINRRGYEREIDKKETVELLKMLEEARN